MIDIKPFYMGRKSFLISFLCIILTIKLLSQNDSKVHKNFFVENKFYYGFVMPHHKSIEYFVTERVPSYEFSITFPTYGDNVYDKYYRFPRYGIGYITSGLGNKNVYGQAHSIFPVFYLPLIKKDKFQLNTRFAYSLAYISKIYDIKNNFENIAIGTHLNIYFNLAADARIKLSKNLELINSIGFTHFSNGRLNSPNLGINLLQFSAGLSYFIEKTERKTLLKDDAHKKQNEFVFIYAPGTKTRNHWDPDRYFTSSISANIERLITPREQIGLGLDIFYDASIRSELEETQAIVKESELYKLGIHASHDFIYKRLAFVVQLGHYVYYSYEDISNFYSRVGFKYKTDKNILLNFTLKSHNTRADFIEWGIGYYLKSK